jgi:DNA-directed RNA polymerase specialized sigma24 family protein
VGGDIGGIGSQADSASGWPLSQTCYRLLVRLAALLTGDAQLAEAIAAAACSAVLRAGWRPDDANALRRLQREIVTQSRQAMRQRHAQGRQLYPADPNAMAFASQPVVTALRGLPTPAREALVLTYYLDLTERQAAAMAGVSLSSLRRNLADALRALPADLPGS